MRCLAPVLLVVAVLASQTAQAGLADPTPTLGGQPSFHLWSVPGVVNNSLTTIFATTIFACSNATSNPIRVGVEAFGPAGGASLDDASAGSGIICSAFLVNTGTGVALVNLTIVSPNAPATAASSSASSMTALAGLLLATGFFVMRRRALV